MTLNNLWNLPGYLARNGIAHAEGHPFDGNFIAHLIRTFQMRNGINAIDYRVVCTFPDHPPIFRFLIVRRDGSWQVSSQSLADMD